MKHGRDRHSVLIVTGGFLNEKETSVLRAARKQLLQWRSARAAWLDLKIKLVMAEPLVAALWRRWTGGRRISPTVSEYFSRREVVDAPELTEVVLMTLLRDAGLGFERASIDDLFARPAALDRLLARVDCVFLSTTLLRDLSELEPVVQRLRRPGLRLVIGGPLAGLLAPDWPGMEGVDVVAVGYGELLAGALTEWIRGGFARLCPPAGGRHERRQCSDFLWSGVPPGRSLDFLPTPDWSLARQVHARALPMIYYESVRGCPYRCNFCNYPYLFDDDQFRYKSAQRIADDWQRYVERDGVEYITCLDSLFTLPRQRLTALCDELVRRKLKVRWVCYARADDLAQPGIAEMMAQAGAVQVQIGIESGDQGQLENMDKQCTVEANAAALRNCRRAGLTSVVSLIVGFPGETMETLERTYRFIAETQPDFYFPATFSTRAYGVPVLSAANRARFGLRTQSQLRTVAPYWRHATMSCVEVGGHVRALNDRIMREGVSLNAALFYRGLLGFRPEQRPALIEFQRSLTMGIGVLRRLFDAANAVVDARMRAEVERWMRTGEEDRGLRPPRGGQAIRLHR